MNKYFFDLVGRQRSEYDYRGRELPSPEKAYQLGELIALDLGIDGQREWSGWSIKVRNSLGQQFFSIPVPQLDLVAA